MTHPSLIDTKLKRMPQTIRVGSRAGGLSEFLSIQVAINYCDAQGGDWTIELYSQAPGGYNEGDITPGGGANITLRGMGVERVVISPVAAPAVAVIVSGFNLALENLVVAAPDATRPALRVTGGVCHAVSSTLAGVAAGDSIQQIAGDLTLDACRVPQDIDLSTAQCDLWANYCLLSGGIDTAGNFAHRMWIKECNFDNSNLNSAAIGATLLFMEGCSYVGIVTNAGSMTFEIRGSFISEINATATGTFIVYGGFVNRITRAAASVVWWQDENTLKVIPSATVTDTVVQYAINAAIAGDVVLIHPGFYNEVVTCKNSVDLQGVGDKGSVIIQQTDAQVMEYASDMAVDNLTIQMLNPSVGRTITELPITAAGPLRLSNIVFGVTNPGVFIMIVISIIGAGAANVIIERCSYNIGGTGTSIGLWNSNNPATIHLRNNDFTFANVNAFHIFSSQAGTWDGGGNRWAGTCGWVSNTFGTMQFNQDAVVCTATSNITGGRVTLKDGRQQYEVYIGMSIQHAIAAAAADTPAPSATAPYAGLIHPGIYNEQVLCSPWVNLRGIGPKGSVIIYMNEALPVVALANNVQLENFTIRLGTLADVNRRHIGDDGVACTARMTDLFFEVVAPGAQAMQVFRLTGAGNYIIERCSHNIGGTGVSNTVLIADAATVRLIDNDFTFTNANAAHIFSNAASAITGKGNRWGGTCAMVNVSAGTITLDNDAMVCTAAWANTGSTMRLRNCSIEAPVVAGNTAIVRLKNCSYRAISRIGTGNIVDESPYPASYAFHVIKKFWEVAVIANMNIATRTAVGGTILVGGNGQARLRINDIALDAAGVESAADAAGAMASTFTPALTPRYCQQIGVVSQGVAFRATNTMFFGLRAVLGAAVPGAAEHHAGFVWDGTNFKASSSNGGGVGATTNLTTPSSGVQVQLEVIIIGGTQVEFYVDGVLVATHTGAAAIPTAALNFQEYEISNGGGGATTSDITLREGWIAECPA